MRAERTGLLRELRGALERGELELYYQPKIDAPAARSPGPKR